MQGVICVKTFAKISLLDFVYLTGCMGCWYGFCPLSTIATVESFVTKKSSSKVQSTAEKVRQMDIDVRRTQHIVNVLRQEVRRIESNHEKEIGELKRLVNL